MMPHFKLFVFVILLFKFKVMPGDLCESLDESQITFHDLEMDRLKEEQINLKKHES